MNPKPSGMLNVRARQSPDVTVVAYVRIKTSPRLG
jgi:hypothetical protein